MRKTRNPKHPKIISFQKNLFLIAFFVLALPNAHAVFAEDGYRVWLRYDLIQEAQKLGQYRSALQSVVIEGNSPIIQATKEEISKGLNGLLGKNIPIDNTLKEGATLLIGTPESSPLIASLNLSDRLKAVGDEGYLIFNSKVNNKKCLVIAANKDIGVLYGVFHLLRLIQTQQDISHLNIQNAPKIQHRVLNHWDNLNGSVERGYAGESLWKWEELPEYKDRPRYKDYARANASIGINGTVLNNVNANATILTEVYLKKVAALADVFRPYGIKVYLSARFSAPMEIGKLPTADPLDPKVQEWWKDKAKEIYALIPDFGGFLVKANSEGQPGPQNYGRTHADGANMLADAVAPFGGIVMWRAFVYQNDPKQDRAKQAYNEFKPLDGQFRKNVLIQVKNGPIDFQPREPFSPLFGAMPHTPLMMEFQITQEYLGQGIHLTYLAPLYKECLDSDTYAKGKGSLVSKVIDGSLEDYGTTGIAGVANIGSDRNWCGHPFAQANWYAYGRLAWDHDLSSEEIAKEWIRMTFSNDEVVIQPVMSMMMLSRKAAVDYRTPLGLAHQMATGHHYGPGPWVGGGLRADWTPIYYHNADSIGLGFDRTATGSDAVSQYFPPVAAKFASLESCPEDFLLWFHHVPWTYKLKSGRNLWDELCHRYYTGVDEVRQIQNTWNGLEGKIDPQRFDHVQALLKIQLHDATVWRDACVLYFQTFSKMPIPSNLTKPAHDLDYYEHLNLKF